MEGIPALTGISKQLSMATDSPPPASLPESGFSDLLPIWHDGHANRGSSCAHARAMLLLPSQGAHMQQSNALPSVLRDLHAIRSATFGIFASDGTLFRSALFGRDALEASEDLLDFHPEIAHSVIRALAALQGRREAAPGPDTSEEEIGKIHHEARFRIVDGAAVDPQSQAIIDRLASRWGGSKDGFVYYGSIDATPLFVRLVSRFCAQYGTAFLDEHITTHTGATITVRDSLVSAADWIDQRISSSRTGFIEFHRRNPSGLPNQAWKDGFASYLHADGSFVNYDAPVAPVEVQGVAYDALRGAAALIRETDPLHAARWERLSQSLQSRILSAFWMPKEGYFAMALDRHPVTGAVRKVETLSSNPGTLLDTTLFDNLPIDLYRTYVGGIVQHIMRKDFLTGVGVRCRSLKHASLTGYADYQGSQTVWPKETYDIAKGLRKHGFSRLARALEVRLLNGMNSSGAHVEFLYAPVSGEPITRPYSTDDAHSCAGTNIPENAQAWSVSAAYAIKRRLGKGREEPEAPTPWHGALEQHILHAIPAIPLHVHAHDIEQETTPRNLSGINIARGKALETELPRSRHHMRLPFRHRLPAGSQLGS